MKHGASVTVEPAVAEDLEVRVPHGLSPSEVALYRLLIQQRLPGSSSQSPGPPVSYGGE